jgi:hypothetical protein
MRLFTKWSMEDRHKDCFGSGVWHEDHIVNGVNVKLQYCLSGIEIHQTKINTKQGLVAQLQFYRRISMNNKQAWTTSIESIKRARKGVLYLPPK